jgi:hypothetical protein
MSSSGSVFLADQLDFVAVSIGNEGDNSAAVFHRSGFAYDFAAELFDPFAGGVDIFHFDGDVAEAVTQIVMVGIPVVCQFDHAMVDFVAVADKSQGEFAFGVILAAQQFHAEDMGIKFDGAVEIAGAEHGMEQAHGQGSCIWVTDCIVPDDGASSGYPVNFKPNIDRRYKLLGLNPTEPRIGLKWLAGLLKTFYDAL